MPRQTAMITVEPEYDLAYLQLATRPVARTEELAEGVNVDLDEMGVLVGVELLSVSAVAARPEALDRLEQNYHVTTAQTALLRSAINVMLSSGAAAPATLRRAGRRTVSAKKDDFFLTATG